MYSKNDLNSHFALGITYLLTYLLTYWIYDEHLLLVGGAQNHRSPRILLMI